MLLEKPGDMDINGSLPLRPVIIVDDTDDDIFFLKRSLSRAGVKSPILAFKTGRQAIEYLQACLEKAGDETLPCMAFVDLYMPICDGFEVLQWRAEHPRLQKILFAVISNSDDMKGIQRAYQSGANTFLTKPVDARQIRSLMQSFDSLVDSVRLQAPRDQRPT